MVHCNVAVILASGLGQRATGTNCAHADDAMVVQSFRGLAASASRCFLYNCSPACEMIVPVCCRDANAE